MMSDAQIRVLLHEDYIYRESYEYYVDNLPDNWNDMTSQQKVEWLSGEEIGRAHV